MGRILFRQLHLAMSVRTVYVILHQFWLRLDVFFGNMVGSEDALLSELTSRLDIRVLRQHLRHCLSLGLVKAFISYEIKRAPKLNYRKFLVHRL